MIRNLIIIDLETTGLEEDATAIEVAVSLFSVPHRAVIRSFSSLILGDSNPAEGINGIPAALLAEGTKAEDVWRGIAKMGARADAVCAHNAAFDSRFVPASVFDSKPWICSCEDLLWPRAERIGMGLVPLALAHGLGVASAHRASVDVDILSRLLSRVAEMGVDLQEFLARGLRPKALFTLADTRFDAARNETAGNLGFRWNKPEAPRQWSRRMAIEDVASLPFEVRQVAA